MSHRQGSWLTSSLISGNVANHETGAFAEYVIAKGDVQLKIPDQLSFEEAATLGVGITTVGQGLYQSLGLPLPNQPAKEKFSILIYGGSTATGTLAIQFAKLYVLIPVFWNNKPSSMIEEMACDRSYIFLCLCLYLPHGRRIHLLLAQCRWMPCGFDFVIT